jgi:hypothetical protein
MLARPHPDNRSNNGRAYSIRYVPVPSTGLNMRRALHPLFGAMMIAIPAAI